GEWYCSCRTPDDANLRDGQLIGAESTQHFRIERGVTREPAVEIVAEPVHAVEFIDQFEEGAGAETVNLLDVMLAPETTQLLRLADRNRIYGLFQARFDFCRTTG